MHEDIQQMEAEFDERVKAAFLGADSGAPLDEPLADNKPAANAEDQGSAEVAMSQSRGVIPNAQEEPQNSGPTATTDAPDPVFYVNQPYGNQFFTGFGSILTINLVGKDGKPILDATATESVVGKSVCEGGQETQVQQNPFPVKINSGKMTDLVGRGQFT